MFKACEEGTNKVKRALGEYVQEKVDREGYKLRRGEWTETPFLALSPEERR